MKLSGGSKDTSEFIDEKKRKHSEEGIETNGECTEVERLRFLGAARGVEFRDLGAMTVASHKT